MFPSPFLLLLLFLRISSTQIKTNECAKSWLCLAAGSCGTTSQRVVSVTGASAVDNKCNIDASKKIMARIREVGGNKYLVILEFVKELNDLKEMTLGISDSNGITDRFGCKVENGKMVPTLATDVMDFISSLSSIDSSTGIHKCVGYAKPSTSEGFEAGNLNKFKLKIAVVGDATPIDYQGSDFPIDHKSVESFHSCDQLQVNAKWRDEHIKEKYLLNPEMVARNVVPLDDKMKASICPKPSQGLFYKKFLDAPSLSVAQISCQPNSHVYSVEIKDQSEPEKPDHPFILFCADHVNTKCTEPGRFQCDDCTPANFTKGEGNNPASIHCYGHSYVVKKINEKDASETRVAADPICRPKEENKKEPEWIIPFPDGSPTPFAGVACHPGLSCFGLRPLSSECEVTDENCTQATIRPTGANCSFGMSLGYHDDRELKKLSTDSIECNWESRDWKPSITKTNVQCYFNPDRLEQNINGTERVEKKEEEQFSWKIIKYFVLVPIFICIIIILFFSIVLICFSRRYSLRKFPYIRKKESIKSIKSSKKSMNIIEYENESDEDEERESIMTGLDKENEKDGMTKRRETYPKVDPMLLRRDDDSVETYHKNLGIVRPDFINDEFAVQFKLYSFHERKMFSEGIVNGLGESTVMETFLEFFMAILYTEDEAAVWENIVSAIRIICFTLNMRKYEDTASRLAVILRQFGKMCMIKCAAFPKGAEHPRTSELRSLGYYALIWIKCEQAAQRLRTFYNTKAGTKISSLRKITWTAAVRNEGKFDEVMQLFSDEVATPSVNDDERFGRKRDHLVYALCASKDRVKSESLMTTLIKEPQYTPRDIVFAFKSMVRDFEECRDVAKDVFMVHHAFIKAKMPVTSPEYKEILKILYTFATLSSRSDDWLVTFTDAAETYTEKERKDLEVDLKKVSQWVDKYFDLVPNFIFDKKNELNLSRTLTSIENMYNH